MLTDCKKQQRGRRRGNSHRGAHFDFDAIRIGLLSPDKIQMLSSGEVTSPETFDEAQRPIRKGLFCEQIFGPIKKGVCFCGGNKGLKRGTETCINCGSELLDPSERRRRLGHITLVSPVVHIWFYKGSQSILARLLGLPPRKLESVIYYQLYIVIAPGGSGLEENQFITFEEYRTLKAAHAGFVAETGAEAIRQILRKLNLVTLAGQLRKKASSSSRARTRLLMVEKFLKSGNNPEWMVMDVIPVLPPDLRPTLFMDDGTIADSDLNTLYARLIRRNQNIRKMIRLGAPTIILNVERRRLQTAVDCLFSNGKSASITSRSQDRLLRSLSDQLGSKQGIFRKNLLAKRVDYSGRSQITVGPELKLHQVGIPKAIALELYKPFIYEYLIRKGFAPNLRQARRLMEQMKPEVWDALDDCIAEHPVIINRAPTLHKLSMQAFDPVLVEGSAIRLHPLVCSGFNADFDGDTMSVHLPLSLEAQTEVRALMMSVNNIFHPATGKSAMSPSQDIVLGLYYLTMEREGGRGEGMVFSDPAEVELAYENSIVEEHAVIQVRVNGSLEKTTAGRAILYGLLPDGIPFSAVNKPMKKKDIGKLVELCYEVQGKCRTVQLLDDLKALGYKHATRSGISLCLDDMHIPSKKAIIIARAQREVEEANNACSQGRLSESERYNTVIDVWTEATNLISEEVMREIKICSVTSDEAFADRGYPTAKGFNSLYIMADSGARGDKNQIRQASGMRGLMAKPSGEIVELPITASLREGLSGFQYFLSAHGARTGRVAAPMKTPISGYFTRRLVCAARDVTITIEDCGSIDGVYKEALREGTVVLKPLEERIWGTYLADNVVDPVSGAIVASYNKLVDDAVLKAIARVEVDRVKVRSPLTCRAERGVCARCYGLNIGGRVPSEIGDSVGIIAAQSIGEPGTQLTLRSFHGGGTASKKIAVTSFESKYTGKVRYNDLKCVRRADGAHVVMNKAGSISIIDEESLRERDRLPVQYGYELQVGDGQHVEAGQVLAKWDAYSMPIIAHAGGEVTYEDIIGGTTAIEEMDEYGIIRRIITGSTESHNPRVLIKTDSAAHQYILPAESRVLLNQGDVISAGTTIASIPKEASKSMDITGGLPRVIELLEARIPANAALISEIDGTVHYGQYVKKRLPIAIKGPELSREYLLPEGRTVTVYDGDTVKAGTPLIDGPLNPHDLINVAGLPAVWSYLLDEVQAVYSSQGVGIHDKHFEVIIRQMTDFVTIMDPGETGYASSEITNRRLYEKKCRTLRFRGKSLPTARPLLVGLTKIPLLSESFLTAASFQNTVRVLTEASIEGRVDALETNAGRIMIGRKIYAGTGLYENPS